jgi:hypothetical protein
MNFKSFVYVLSAFDHLRSSHFHGEIIRLPAWKFISLIQFDFVIFLLQRRFLFSLLLRPLLLLHRQRYMQRYPVMRHLVQKRLITTRIPKFSVNIATSIFIEILLGVIVNVDEVEDAF